MSIRITKLHLILFLTAVALTGFFFTMQNENLSFGNFFSFLAQFSVISKKTSSPSVKVPEPEPVNIEQIRHNTQQVIAIAGEEMKIAKKQGKDIVQGQGTLRYAKELFTDEKYIESESYALQSIQEFKKATMKLLSSYRIKRGDNLWDISKRKDVYGRGAKWVKLWRANEEKIPDFDYIYRGQVLKVPRD